MNILDQIYAARRVATPLIAVSTPDPAQTIESIRSKFEDGAKTPIPIVKWDAHVGMSGLNTVGREALRRVLGDDEKTWPGLSANPATALGFMSELPGEIREGDQGPIQQRATIVFALNLQRYFEDKPGAENGPVIQGVWNLRDLYKRNRRTLVMLGPSFQFPAEIAQDVIEFDEPLPQDEQLKQIVNEQVEQSGLPALKDDVVSQAVDAVRGMPSFTAEQIVAMSLTNNVLDIDQLWQRKITVAEQTQGIKVDMDAASFDDAGGLEQIKKFSLLLAKGKNAPLLIVRIDELEKSMGGIGAGNAGDNTGTSQDRLGVCLKAMENNNWPGLIAVGPAGTGKTLLSKGLASTASKVTGRRVLSIEIDLSATANSLVGASEKAIRNLFKTINGLGGKGRVFFVATCNKLDVLPPELRRRFRFGIWFFDLPTAEERESIWKINLAKYELKNLKRPDDTNWTGADIRNVCDIAFRLGCSLVDAAQFIVPVAKSDPESIDRLRRLADGKFLSASYAGAYKAESYLKDETPAPTTTKRASRANEEV